MKDFEKTLDDIVGYWSDDYSIMTISGRLFVEIVEIDKEDIETMKDELAVEGIKLAGTSKRNLFKVWAL